jgi:hypothetical protein
MAQGSDEKSCLVHGGRDAQLGSVHAFELALQMAPARQKELRT